MKKTLLTMAAALALVGCSNDDLMTGLENNGTQNKGAIGVNTFIANGTRGVAYDNVEDFRNDDGNFDLYAWEKLETETYQENPFMSDVKFVVADNGGWDYENKGEVRFWQELGEGSTVDFYAVSPAGLTANNIDADTQTIPFTVAESSVDQVDLMYATAKEINADGTTAEGDDAKKNGVKLDFHHALSQIVFKAKVHQDYMNYVSAEVERVEIVNLYGTGIFNFANAANGVYSEDTKVSDSWIYQDMDGNDQSADASYTAEFTDPVSVNADYTSEDEQSLTDKTTALLLLPQNITGAEIEDNKEEPTEGTYFAVTCKVWYQRTTDAGSENILIVGNKDENTGEETSITLYYPLNTSWYEGWKYTYTFVFSANTADPITISEETSVDAWWPGEYDDNNTDVPETGEQDPEKSEDELTQAELNARLVAAQFATANAQTLIDNVTDKNPSLSFATSLPMTLEEANNVAVTEHYFSQYFLNLFNLWNTVFTDENGQGYRVPTMGELAMLVPMQTISEENGAVSVLNLSNGNSTFEVEETIYLENADDHSVNTSGTTISGSSTFYTSNITDQSLTFTTYVGYALRFKGSEQYAAYRYNYVKYVENEGNTKYGLNIKIKALKTDDTATDIQTISNEDYWTSDVIDITLPAMGYMVENSLYNNIDDVFYLSSTKVIDYYEDQGVLGFENTSLNGYVGALGQGGLNQRCALRLIKCDSDGNLVLE